MNYPRPNLASLLGAVVTLASLGFAGHSSAALLENGSGANAISASKDKICVVSQNTGLSMWYSPFNHGFTSATVANADLGFAPTEQLVFGLDHQLAPGAFDDVSVLDIQTDTSLDRFVSGATTGLGSKVGFIFGKDGQLYLASRSTPCEFRLVDPKGSMLEAYLAFGRSERREMKVIALAKLATVPEPSSFALFGIAAGVFAMVRRRRS